MVLALRSGQISFFFCFFFPIPFIIFALLFSLPPRRNSDPGSQQALLPPYPPRFVPCIFYREKLSALFSLVDSRRIVTCGGKMVIIERIISRGNMRCSLYTISTMYYTAVHA